MIEIGRPLLFDLTGKRFGRLVVVEHVGSGKWLCKCDCGKKKTVGGSDLRKKKVISCGCARNERIVRMSTTHNLSHERLYGVWQNMLNRCYNPNAIKYKDYGARGISVCDEWRSGFDVFHKWAMSTGYDPNAPYGQCTLDRIDVNGNYEPDNCRWADAKTQANNKRPREYVPTHVTAVERIDDDGNVIQRFKSIAEASRQTGCAHTSITAVCKGRYKTSLGMRWRYSCE